MPGAVLMNPQDAPQWRMYSLPRKKLTFRVGGSIPSATAELRKAIACRWHIWWVLFVWYVHGIGRLALEPLLESSAGTEGPLHRSVRGPLKSV